jgi:hypothetical protein
MSATIYVVYSVMLFCEIAKSRVFMSATFYRRDFLLNRKFAMLGTILLCDDIFFKWQIRATFRCLL